ncbi:MAG: hypothetical protein ACFE0I_02490 [Elainellaceae cyanobacterium]
MKFQHTNNYVLLHDGKRSLRLHESKFKNLEPDYTLPSDVRVRYFDGNRHYVIDAEGNQSLAEDIPTSQLESYIGKIRQYRQTLPEASKPESSPDLNWSGLESSLRGSAAWSRVFQAMGNSTRAQASGTLILITLASTHVLRDLIYGFNSLRAAMQAQAGISDFSNDELDFVASALEANGFDPSAFELGGD